MKTKQLIQHYVLAIYYGAEKHPRSYIFIAMCVVRARIKYGIGPFHFSLFRLAQIEESGWDNYIIMRPSLDRKRDALSSDKARRRIANKLSFYKHCRRAGLPTIPIICCVGGNLSRENYSVEHVKDVGRFKTLLFSAPPCLLIKPVDGSHGDNVFLVTQKEGKCEFKGKKASISNLFDYLENKVDTQNGFIIQPQIRPHDQMLPFASSDGLPTVRVVTAMYADEPQVLFACLRVPVGTNVTDNFGKGINGNLVAGIDVENGILTAARGSSSTDWPVMMQTDTHPDTGYRITGSSMPFWAEIVQTALRGQRSLPDLKTIGWDIAVRPDGILLVELNTNYGMYSLQVAYQRGLKTELEAKLNIMID